MKNATKLERSNNAHSRLFNKFVLIFGDHDACVKQDYHFLVLDLQRRSGKVLPRHERKVLYDQAYSSVYGNRPKGSKSTFKQWTSIVRKYYEPTKKKRFN